MIKQLRRRLVQASSSSLMVSAAILLMACGLSDEPRAAASTISRDETPTSASDAVVTPTDSSGNGGVSTLLSLTETENMVRGQAATLLQVSADQIQTIEASARTWPDRGLGCGARRGMYESEPTPGYLIVLSHGSTTLSYHADQHGRFVRCDEASRPRPPIR